MFGLDLKQFALVFLLVCAIIFGVGYKTAQFNERRTAEPVITAKPVEPPQQEKKKNIAVYVVGAVKNPGVYTLTDGSRVVEAIEKAETVKEADLTRINLAEVVKDEMPIYVPRKGEMGPSGGSDGVISTDSGMRSFGLNNSNLGRLGKAKVNINTARSGELDQLTGIGPALAERIIDYRNEHGKFNNISELKQVSGIGTNKFEEIKEHIAIK